MMNLKQPLLPAELTPSKMCCFIVHTERNGSCTQPGITVSCQLLQGPKTFWECKTLIKSHRTELSPTGILLSKDKAKQCSISWHFWLGWTMWSVKLLFSSPFLKTRTCVSWPNKNLLTQCWNHNQRQTILALGLNTSEGFWKFKDKGCCLLAMLQMSIVPTDVPSLELWPWLFTHSHHMDSLVTKPHN